MTNNYSGLLDLAPALIHMQIELFQAVNTAVRGGENIPFLVNGGLGTGNPHFCEIIVDELGHGGMGSRETAFMWSAIFQLYFNGPKLSVHSLMKSRHNEINMKKLMQNKKWPHLDHIVSQSMVDAPI